MLARAERFGWYNAWKDEECAEGENFRGKNYFGNVTSKILEHASLVVYIFVELRIKRALSLSLFLSSVSQLIGSTLSWLALPGLDSATMRAKSLTTVAGISSHSSDRV